MNRPTRLYPLALSIALVLGLAACTSTEQDAAQPQIEPARPSTPLAEKARAEEQRRLRAEVARRDALLKRELDELSRSTDAAPAASAAVQEGKTVRMVAPTGMLQGFNNAPIPRAPTEPLDTENYQHFDDNPVKRVAEQPVSTFSIDVDTGAYANLRRVLNQGQLPRQDAVRVEELINYFSYDYPQPQGQQPFSVTTELSPTPWNRDTLLLHVGIQGKDIAKQTLPAANLVFLVDVSGSMQAPDKLELLKTSLKLLTKQLRAKDRVSLVVYAGGTGVVLPPTPGNNTLAIGQALQQLQAGGRTNGAAGIQLAYQVAEQAFIKDGINRVLLATDGDFNVGTVNFEALLDLVEAKRKTGVSLTTLGFGTGNYNDHLMEQLADAGNGNYAYIDTLNEAQKVLVDEMSSTLATIASDVKIQLEFNPATVSEYRLLGYENRALRREDFNNDKVDAGEIGAGHTVTALYEIALVDGKGNYTDPLRYGKQPQPGKTTDELAFLRLRYKQPGAESSTLLEQPLVRQDIVAEIGKTSDAFRFAAAVAAFGQQLRGAKYLKQFSYADVLRLARDARGNDPFAYRGEFLKLVNLAQSLSGQANAANRAGNND